MFYTTEIETLEIKFEKPFRTELQYKWYIFEISVLLEILNNERPCIKKFVALWQNLNL
jgi:hypothetical protein